MAKKKKVNIKPDDIVKVHWVDAASKHEHWTSKEEALEGVDQVFNVFSVGFVLYIDKDKICLIQSDAPDSHEDEDDMIHSMLTIPTGWIKDITVLQRGGD